ncbi:MAG TPA: hypothetical protein DDZ68_15450 [Parvularcula sp.]|nr:hypothetical protein [Parvularcula sp.]
MIIADAARGADDEGEANGIARMMRARAGAGSRTRRPFFASPLRAGLSHMLASPLPLLRGRSHAIDG